MAFVTTVTQVPIQNTGLFARTARSTTSVTGSMDWTRFEDCNVTVQVDGAATAITLTVERTTQDPTSGVAVTAAPASTTTITGNPATGIQPSVYIETGVAWWRATLSALTGTATVALSGKGS